MPTNNPNQTSSQPTSKGGGVSENAASRIEQGGQRAEKTIERFEKTAEQAASSAINRVREAREQATSGISQQRDAIATRIRKVGDVLRSGSEQLATDDPLAHSVLSFVSERADGISSYVREATPSALADDLQSFARRRPGVFFGGAFLLGLALGRFAKSSTGGGGGSYRDDADAYADDADEPDYQSEYRSLQSSPRVAPVAVSEVYKPSTDTYAKPQADASLPYVSAGSGIGANPSSATYGASTATGTSAPSAPRPSYGSTTVGGTGGYGSPGSGGTPVDTRPSQVPAPRESSSSLPASPRAHVVEPGEGSKS